MKKVESIFNGSLGWGKTRPFDTLPKILFGLLSIILPKIFTIKGVEEDAGASHPNVEALFKRKLDNPS